MNRSCRISRTSALPTFRLQQQQQQNKKRAPLFCFIVFGIEISSSFFLPTHQTIASEIFFILFIYHMYSSVGVYYSCSCCCRSISHSLFWTEWFTENCKISVPTIGGSTEPTLRDGNERRYRCRGGEQKAFVTKDHQRRTVDHPESWSGWSVFEKGWSTIKHPSVREYTKCTVLYVQYCSTVWTSTLHFNREPYLSPSKAVVL